MRSMKTDVGDKGLPWPLGGSVLLPGESLVLHWFPPPSVKTFTNRLPRVMGNLHNHVFI